MQVNIYNVRRKSYASTAPDAIHMTKVTPWGVETVMTLLFREKAYAILTSDDRYLAVDGSLEPSCSTNTLYTIEFYSGNIAFKSKENGK